MTGRTYTPAHPFVFFHIPKCGGSSMREMLYRALAPPRDEEVLYPCHNGQSCFMQLAWMPRVSYYLSHVNRTAVAERIRKVRNEEEAGHESSSVSSFRDIDCVVVLRNPFHRMVSDYYMFHYDGFQTHHRKPFAQLVRETSPEYVFNLTGGNVQTRVLGGAHASLSWHEVALQTTRECESGTFEKYDEFRHRLATRMGLVLKPLRVQPSRHTSIRSADDYLLEPRFTALLAPDRALWTAVRNMVPRDTLVIQ